MQSKQCTSCKNVKDIDKFQKDSRYKSGVRSQCIDCKYTSPNSKKARFANHLSTKYGITIEEWESRLQDQNGVCDICKRPETRITRPNAKKYLNGETPKLSLDHNHTTGKARGLLCYKCNIGIGHLQESIENLEAAILYLKKWKTND